MFVAYGLHLLNPSSGLCQLAASATYRMRAGSSAAPVLLLMFAYNSVFRI